MQQGGGKQARKNRKRAKGPKGGKNKGTVRGTSVPSNRPWQNQANANDRLKEKIKQAAQQLTAADLLLRADGGHGTDTRVSAHQVVRLSKVANVDETMDIRAGLPVATLESLAYGVILYSLKRGLGTQLGYQQLYFAYVYMVQTFLTTARGTFPSLQQAPRWFWAICEALKPKELKFKTGSVNFWWQPDQPNVFVSAYKKDFGGFTGVLGVPSALPGDTVNGFPKVLDPGPYTEDAGSSAIQLVFDCFPESYITEKVSFEESWLGRDVSAFAWSYAEWGMMASGPGGLATTLFCEKKILAPIFAKFALYQANGIWRGAQELRKGAGSPMYIAPRSIEFSSMRDYANKQSPIFKIYDFDEFFEQLALTLAGALQIQSAIVGETAVACPLSPLRVQILLRQAMIQVFSNHMAMDIIVAGSGSLPWAPFVVAVNGVSQTLEAVGGMLLPTLFTESIRACGRKTAALGTGKGVKKRGVAIQDEVPILGRYSSPQLGNYFFQPPLPAPVVPVFTPDLLEVPISLVDGGVPLALPVDWVSFDGAEIIAICNVWNSWIQGLSSFLSPLCTIGAEKGIDVLCSLPLTDHTSLQDDEEQLAGNGFPVVGAKSPVVTQVLAAQSSKSSSPVLAGKDGMPPRKMSVEKNLGTTVKRLGVSDPPPPPESEFYTTVKMVQTTSMFPLHDPVWKYGKHFIHPTAIGNVNDEQAVPFQQSLAVEPYKISYSSFVGSNTAMMSLYDKHLNASKLDIRSRLAPATEMAEEFMELAKQGRGGLFTGIAGAIGNMLGIPGSKDFMSGVSDLTGGFL